MDSLKRRHKLSTMRGAALLLLLLACGAASATEEKISVAATIGVFVPTSSATREKFGNTWLRVSLQTFEREKPTSWRFIAEASGYKLDGTTKVRLIPLTFGVEKGLRERLSFQPYVTVRAGPYYGKFEDTSTGVRETHIGLNANAAYGVIYRHRYYAEVRYDYFTRLAGANFNGLSLSVGVRLFDVRL